MNLCRLCGEQFASVEAFDYHLPPAQLSPSEARLVHPDAADLRAWGLARNARGAWTIKDPDLPFGSSQRLMVRLRADIWPERLREAGLA